MLRESFAALSAVAFLSGCVMPAPQPGGSGSGQFPGSPYGSSAQGFSQDQATRRFVAVVDRVEPVAETACRQLAPRASCNFTIYVDPDRTQPANAAQTLDKNGNPVVIFNINLLMEARNEDELAFVLGHEVAHHIRGHINRAQNQAMTGALLGSVAAVLIGADQAGIEQAGQYGAAIGARRFSKDHELEADALGARIAWRAGYDPERGAEFFFRTPDPGNQFLGSHPPNADRVATVQREVARIRAGN